MMYIEGFIYVLIGAIGGRAVAKKDWVTFIIAITLFISFLVYDFLRYKQSC